MVTGMRWAFGVLFCGALAGAAYACSSTEDPPAGDDASVARPDANAPDTAVPTDSAAPDAELDAGADTGPVVPPGTCAAADAGPLDERAFRYIGACPTTCNQTESMLLEERSEGVRLTPAGPTIQGCAFVGVVANHNRWCCPAKCVAEERNSCPGSYEYTCPDLSDGGRLPGTNGDASCEPHLRDGGFCCPL